MVIIDVSRTIVHFQNSLGWTFVRLPIFIIEINEWLSFRILGDGVIA